MNSIAIGQRLRKLRENLTQEKVANDCGISTSALAMYEAGKRIPRDEVKVKLANYYQVDVYALFFATDSHIT